ncbi:hypothetical protein [Roseibium aggregatum]|uniref:hypothetical protein n=1 Tax=Roseibium aggregatum TaxID=187304 RepID=UPI0012F4E2FA|nr:hypothetical protein [Roseibium aggregatum]
MPEKSRVSYKPEIPGAEVVYYGLGTMDQLGYRFAGFYRGVLYNPEKVPSGADWNKLLKDDHLVVQSFCEVLSRHHGLAYTASLSELDEKQALDPVNWESWSSTHQEIAFRMVSAHFRAR